MVSASAELARPSKRVVRIAPESSVPPASLADIRKDGEDDCGEAIIRVYYRSQDFAVYGTADRVRVRLSDDRRKASRQFRKIAPLFPLRDELQYLATDMAHRGRVDCYRLQIAEAFRIGLEGRSIKEAAQIMQGAIANASDKLSRRGRLRYLIAAGACCAVLATCLFLAAEINRQHVELALMLRSAGSGAIGALLSIAIAIRKRAVVPERDLWANIADAAVRTMIGVLSGGGIYLLLRSGLVGPELTGALDQSQAGVGDASSFRWQTPLALGFVAGFLERMVPDLLDRRTPPEPTPNAAAPRRA